MTEPLYYVVTRNGLPVDVSGDYGRAAKIREELSTESNTVAIVPVRGMASFESERESAQLEFEFMDEEETQPNAGR